MTVGRLFPAGGQCCPAHVPLPDVGPVHGEGSSPRELPGSSPAAPTPAGAPSRPWPTPPHLASLRFSQGLSACPGLMRVGSRPLLLLDFRSSVAWPCSAPLVPLVLRTPRPPSESLSLLLGPGPTPSLSRPSGALAKSLACRDAAARSPWTQLWPQPPRSAREPASGHPSTRVLGTALGAELLQVPGHWADTTCPRGFVGAPPPAPSSVTW